MSEVRSGFYVVAVWSSVHRCWMAVSISSTKIKAYRLFERLRAVLPVHVQVVEVAEATEEAQAAALDALVVPSLTADDLFVFDGVFDRFVTSAGEA